MATVASALFHKLFSHHVNRLLFYFLHLTVLFFGDLLWVTGAFLPDYAASVDSEHVQFNDKMCMYMQCFQLTGRVGTSLIIIMLALERVLLLSKPARFVVNSDSIIR